MYIRPWCDPQTPQAQVESLLYVAVALATTAKIYHTKRETLQTAKELFTVPLMYDPRFQVRAHTHIHTHTHKRTHTHSPGRLCYGAVWALCRPCIGHRGPLF